MTIEEFKKFIGELDGVCEKYDVDIEIVAGKLEPIDIDIHITTKID